jgi:hypothetical protein
MTRKALSNVCFVVAALFFVVDLRTSTWSEASLVSGVVAVLLVTGVELRRRMM